MPIAPDKPIPTRISLRTDRCWLIRATSPSGSVQYMVTDSEWSSLCTDATLFRSYEAAEHTMLVLRAIATVHENVVLDIGLLSSAITQNHMLALQRRDQRRKRRPDSR